jgi:transposase
VQAEGSKEEGKAKGVWKKQFRSINDSFLKRNTLRKNRRSRRLKNLNEKRRRRRRELYGNEKEENGEENGLEIKSEILKENIQDEREDGNDNNVDNEKRKNIEREVFNKFGKIRNFSDIKGLIGSNNNNKIQNFPWFECFSFYSYMFCSN